MLRNLAWGYFVLCVVMTVLDVRDSLERQWPRWLLALDVTQTVLALLGMLLWLTGSAPEPLRFAWRVVAPLLVLGFVTVSVLEVRALERRPDPDLSPRESVVTLYLGVVLGILVMIPILCVNWLLAYGELPWFER